MAKTAIACIFGVVLASCGEISRIDQDAMRPATIEATVADAPISAAPSPTYATRTTGHTHPVVPSDNPMTGASNAQTWRLTQQSNAIARIPTTRPVPQSDIDELRRQRMQAEAIAGSGLSARPVLGPGSGNGTFSFPAPSTSPALSGAISRANAAEVSASTR